MHIDIGKSLSDPKMWYAINRIQGRDLLIAGTLITLGSVAIPSWDKVYNRIHVALTLLRMMVFTLSGAAFHGYIVLRRM